MIRYLILVLALLLVAIRPAPAQQGNLPKPVQALPSYPPVVCVAPNWKPEPCEKRREQAEQDGWAEVGKALAEFFKFLDWTKTNWLGTVLEYDKPGAWNGVWPKQRQITVLYNEPGGVLPDHVRRWQDLAASGDAVEIRGDCMSACTLIMSYVPSERICFGESASLQFHPVRARETGDLLANETARMVNSYPLDIHEWIKAKGGVSKMAVGQMWVLDAPTLWKMGYQKCAPEPAPAPMTNEPAPVPMTIRPSALQHYRPKWETAEDAEIREREEWRKRDETAAQRYREWIENEPYRAWQQRTENH